MTRSLWAGDLPFYLTLNNQLLLSSTHDREIYQEKRCGTTHSTGILFCLSEVRPVTAACVALMNRRILKLYLEKNIFKKICSGIFILTFWKNELRNRSQKIRNSRTSQGQAVCFGTGDLNKKKKEAVHLFNVVGLVSSVYFGKMCFYGRIDADIRLSLSGQLVSNKAVYKSIF